MNLVPLGDRVVLKQLEAEEKTKSGIVLGRQGDQDGGQGRRAGDLFQIRRYRSEAGRGRVHHRQAERHPGHR